MCTCTCWYNVLHLHIHTRLTSMFDCFSVEVTWLHQHSIFKIQSSNTCFEQVFSLEIHHFDSSREDISNSSFEIEQIFITSTVLEGDETWEVGWPVMCSLLRSFWLGLHCLQFLFQFLGHSFQNSLKSKSL